jgi:metal-responsive CopG/Arc/MetJ family transcriptional regulator
MKTVRNTKSIKMLRTAAVRASISFPPGLYGTLEDIAKQKKVSLAWIVRDAAEKYVAEQAAEARRRGL